MGKSKERLKKLWRWLRINVFNKKMIVYMLISELIFWSPCIVTGIMALCVDPWWWSATTTIILFWAGPFTPAIELQIGLALLIKKIVERKRK